jgi:hypothetical protein
MERFPIAHEVADAIGVDERSIKVKDHDVRHGSSPE